MSLIEFCDETYVVECCEGLTSALMGEVCRILMKCDREFVPPLSERVSTRQQMWGNASVGGVDMYLSELSRQGFLLACDGDGHLCAFLSYINDFEAPAEVNEGLVTYVTTICTAHAYRGRGLARTLYSELERMVESGTIVVRTWSTNGTQEHLLSDMGYELRHRVLGDRGEGIDSVYFAKRVGDVSC